MLSVVLGAAVHEPEKCLCLIRGHRRRSNVSSVASAFGGEFVSVRFGSVRFGSVGFCFVFVWVGLFLVLV